ncbi:MAG: DMT family transporter, partial [Thermoplasmata archaeon]|nr:DMT family transporter [Thermoplasmata archaeon]
NYLFVRAGLHDAAPLWLAFLRSGVGALGAAVFLLPPSFRGHLDGPGKRAALVLGIPNTALFFGLWFLAAGSILPGLAAVIVYTFPFWVAILSGPVLGHRLSAFEWLAVGIGFFGVVLIAQPWTAGGSAIPPWAVAELLVGAVSWGIGTVYFQKRFRGPQLVEANAYQLAGGALVLLAASLVLEGTAGPEFSLQLLGIVLWLGLIGTAFAYGVWFWLLSKTRAARLSSYLFLVPVVALLASAIVYGERLNSVQISGVLLVLLALYGVGVYRVPSET